MYKCMYPMFSVYCRLYNIYNFINGSICYGVVSLVCRK